MKISAVSKKKKVLIILLLSLIIIAAIPFIINTAVVLSTSDKVVDVEAATEFKADCILVLGAGISDDGSPSRMLEDRLKKGIELYKSGASDKLLMSGDHGATQYDEVNVMKDYAVNAGVPSEDIFMDHAGFSTYESVYRAKEVFKAEKIIFVTQGYHLPRALYIAACFGIDARGVSGDTGKYTLIKYYKLREFAARNKDFVMCILKPQPTYLGEEIPVFGNGDVTNDKNNKTSIKETSK
ncbi:MAG: vancomycin high temperature exclusion protein [Eubacteriales bacterium]